MACNDVIESRAVDDPALDQPPVGWCELLAVILVIALADLTLYRGFGYAGYAAFFAGVPWLLVLGMPAKRANRSRCWGSAAVVGVLLVILAGRMLWCGSAVNNLAGSVLLMAFALALSGLIPYMLEILVFPAQVVLGGLLGLVPYARLLRRPAGSWSRLAGLSILLPALTFLAFSLLFILANPDLLTAFGDRISHALECFRAWLIEFAPQPTELVFWCVTAWITVGMLRPLWSRPLLEEWERREQDPKRGGAPASSPVYAACRNTLVTVIVLFAIYLVFEFKTLWWRVFPPGYHYSGYAHQGAAWLTVALALATLILSLAFRGSILQDPRLRVLRRWAWIWSLENVLLAIAVYHRLTIYVGFNGMTRMRVIGFFGITAVLIGFLLVVWKIAGDRGFLWLLRRHLWTVALAVYVYSVMPVDVFVVQYNVRRLLAGDSAPSVQISVHEISAEGLLCLSPLIECDDVLVRDGVRAYLADKLEQAESREAERSAEGWTSYQIADQLLLQELRGLSAHLTEFRDPDHRKHTLQHFHAYAFRWY